MLLCIFLYIPNAPLYILVYLCLQLMLGAMFFEGLGVEQSYNTAFSLYKVHVIGMHIKSLRGVPNIGRSKELCSNGIFQTWSHVR